MSQTNAIVDALKAVLKSQTKTYRDVATALEISEASVKRLFSEQSFSLQRLEQVCSLLEISVAELTQQAEGGSRYVSRLSIEQEQQIAKDISLMLVTACVLNRWSLKDITSHYTLSELDCIQLLAQLDRLQLIDLLPGNHIKLRIAPNFSWHPNGPIQQFFQDRVASEYFNSRFTRDSEKLLCLNGMLSINANAAFQRKLEQLAKEFDSLNNEDASLPISKRHGTTVVLAIRQWEYGLFAEFRRKA
ncbi:MAG: helix-turn-helix domain-containing protein [Gammaproteobacteria bacterium]